jgi:hypothetical protein
MRERSSLHRRESRRRQNLTEDVLDNLAVFLALRIAPTATRDHS